jgi:hypothetical protein
VVKINVPEVQKKPIFEIERKPTKKIVKKPIVEKEEIKEVVKEPIVEVEKEEIIEVVKEPIVENKPIVEKKEIKEDIHYKLGKRGVNLNKKNVKTPYPFIFNLEGEKDDDSDDDDEVRIRKKIEKKEPINDESELYDLKQLVKKLTEEILAEGINQTFNYDVIKRNTDLLNKMLEGIKRKLKSDPLYDYVKEYKKQLERSIFEASWIYKEYKPETEGELANMILFLLKKFEFGHINRLQTYGFDDELRKIERTIVENDDISFVEKLQLIEDYIKNH